MSIPAMSILRYTFVIGYKVRQQLLLTLQWSYISRLTYAYCLFSFVIKICYLILNTQWHCTWYVTIKTNDKQWKACLIYRDWRWISWKRFTIKGRELKDLWKTSFIMLMCLVTPKPCTKHLYRIDKNNDWSRLIGSCLLVFGYKLSKSPFQVSILPITSWGM